MFAWKHGARPDEVVKAHQQLSNMMLCAREPSVLGQSLRSTPSILMWQCDVHGAGTPSPSYGFDASEEVRHHDYQGPWC